MLSNILNSHPGILSLSEFFAFHGTAMFRRRRLTGDRMWDTLSRQSGWTRFMLRGRIDEILYPLDAPQSRYSHVDVPPILCTTLPHITNRCEELFDEMEPVVRGLPRRTTEEQLRAVFDWLRQRTGARVWVERSGGSATYAGTLLNRFPDARIVHLFRDGRETALSMMDHASFRNAMVYLLALRKRGYDPLKRKAWNSPFWDMVSLNLDPVIYVLLLPKPVPCDQLRLTDFGTMWSDLVVRSLDVIDRLPAERVLNLSLENVVTQPERELRRLIRFIDPGLEDDEWVAEAAKRPRQERSAAGDLDPAEREALTQACRPGLERLGYDV